MSEVKRLELDFDISNVDLKTAVQVELDAITTDNKIVYNYDEYFDEGINKIIVSITYGVFKINHSFLLDGISKGFSLSEVLPLLATTTKGGWLITFRPPATTPSKIEKIISFGDTSTNTFIQIDISVLGIVKFRARLNGVNQWTVETDANPFLANTWITIGGITDGITPRILINGVQVAQTFTVSLDKTIWFNDLPLIDNGFIGLLETTGNPKSGFLTGHISQFGFLNTDESNVNILKWNNLIKPLSANTTFGNKSVFEFNPDKSNSLAQFTVKGNNIESISENLIDSDKTNITPY